MKQPAGISRKKSYVLILRKNTHQSNFRCVLMLKTTMHFRFKKNDSSGQFFLLLNSEVLSQSL